MRDHLLDLVQHTHDLGVIDLIKITGSDTETIINAVAEDRSVVVEGKFANPVADFIGTFGMPNLGKLKILLNLQEYKEDAKLAITRKDTGAPDGINFENKGGDFKNNYRLMAAEIVNEKLKTVKFKGAAWDVAFEPSVASIGRLRLQAAAHTEETTFQVKTEGGNLVFFFGDASTHAGSFVFHANIDGKLKQTWSWPVNQVMAILALGGDKTMRIADAGAMQITVDSGLAEYNYILPAQSK
jgi:hypothetical protein